MSDLAFLLEDSKHIQVTATDSGHPVLNVKNSQAEAGVAIQGAHVTHYQPANERPVIFMSPSAEYKAGKALRGGIQSAGHGLVRIQR